MTKFFGITYHADQYLVETLENIKDLGLDITIIDSKSPNSTKIKEICLDYLKNGVIKCFIEASGNCKGFGLRYAIQRSKPEESFFIASDMDVLDPSCTWLGLLNQHMSRGNLLCGFSLDRSNYIPPNYGHSDDGFGFWFMGINTNFYFQHGVNYTVDSKMIAAAKHVGSVYQSPHKLIHRGWDIWKDYPDYFKIKVNGVEWSDVPPDITYTVYE